MYNYYGIIPPQLDSINVHKTDLCTFLHQFFMENGNITNKVSASYF